MFSDFIYHGGPVINTPQVHILFVGDWSSAANQNRATRLSQFVSDLLSSRYMNILSQYGCGTSGTVASTTFVSVPNNALSTSDVHSIIQETINNNEVPEPTDQATCVLLYLDDATGVNDTEAAGAVMCEATSDTAFGYHYHFTTTGGNICPFGVVPGLTNTCLQNSCPDDSSCTLHLAQTQEQRQTAVTSHELSEMFSDPHVIINSDNTVANAAWISLTSGENGDICAGDFGTITVGSNTWTVQEMYSKWHDMTSDGATTCITDCDPLPSLLPACTVILDRSTFGKDEVDALVHAASPNPGLVEAAFYIAVDGFTPADLGITSASLSGTPNVIPALTLTPLVTGMTVEATGLVAEDPSLDGSIQRFTWICRANFANSDGFPATVGDTSLVTLSASVARVGDPSVNASGHAVIELIHEPNPYEIDGQVSWLSTDLRVFQVPAGGSALGAVMGSTAAEAPNFIQNVIGNLNSGNTGGPSFDDLSTDENASQLELSQTVNGTAIFNFALARVRYRSLATDISNVRVFFRLWPVSTTSTSYDQTTSYRRGDNSGVTIPLLGINGGEISSIPFFATPRVDSSTASMTTQTDPANVLPMDHDASGAETVAYFGAWLDINQASQPQFPLNPSPPDGPFGAAGRQTIQQLIRGAHQCLIAEIAFDPDPIPTGATPGSSDKLAQRNLAIVASANPGDPASRSIPSPFEVARRIAHPDVPEDELLIDWRTLPKGSVATFYIPGTSASELKRKADERYITNHLSLIDAHTLSCPARGITYLPIPSGTGPNLPGLITVTLPDGVRHGQAFKIVVRELTDAAVQKRIERSRPPVRGGRPAAAASRTQGLLRWRRVTGSYQISIPVRTKDVLLQPEERLLAVLRWILESIPPGNRWRPVFERYLEEIVGRVKALGGDPATIKPSGVGRPAGKKEPRHSLTGKVSEVIFDCFGEFEGFVIVTCDEQHRLNSRDCGIRELALRAAREHLTIIVRLDDTHPPHIEGIIVRA